MIRFILPLVGLASLAACASPYVATPYVPGNVPISKIAVADDSVPEEASAYEVASVGSNFGLIGALIDAGVQSSRKSRVNDALAGVDFGGDQVEVEFENYLVEAFKEKGVETIILDGENRKKREFLTDYPESTGDAEAYLDVVLVNYGYVASGDGQPWRPTVAANVRLVDATSGSTLLENRIAYNIVNSQQGVLTLYPSPEDYFNNRADMVDNPERLATGIRNALKEVASATAELLNQPGGNDASAN